MKKTVFAGNNYNQYSAESIMRESSDFFGQALRTIDSRAVTGYYSHFRADYDSNSNPTLVKYYRGVKATETLISCVAATNLASKYFIIHSAPDNKRYAIYFTVDGIGTGPALLNTTNILISLASTDSAEVVAAIIKLTLDSGYSSIFAPINRNGISLSILTNGLGETDPSIDFNTSFTISSIEGSQELVSELAIQYQGTDPVFEGQVLMGYSFDVYNGKFVKNVSLVVDNVEIDVSLNAFDSTPDSVLIVGSEDGTESGNKRALKVGTEGDLRVKDEESVQLLTDISQALSAPLEITQPIISAGTIDGTPTGTAYVNVNNIRQQILAAHDRVANFTYSDFGTKNERVSQITYSSATFSGITIVREFNYTLVSNQYRRDSESWYEI